MTTMNLIKPKRGTQIALHLKLTGEAPLLMHAPTLLDPLHPLTQEMRALTSKPAKNKTAADHERIGRLEWDAALYHDSELGPFIDATAIKEAIRAAAGKERKGASIRRGVILAASKIALQYDGPRDRDGLWDEGFRDVRPVRNGGIGGGRVMRTRPCFEEWSLDVGLYLDPHELALDDFARFVEASQRYGIGDYRPDFGLFTAELYEA